MGADTDTIHGIEFRKYTVTLRVREQHRKFSLSVGIFLYVHVLNNVAEECAKVGFNLQTRAVKNDIVLTLLSICTQPIIPDCY